MYTWTSGKVSQILFPRIIADQDYTLRLTAFPAGVEHSMMQHVRFEMNGQLFAEIEFISKQELILTVPKGAMADRSDAKLTMHLPNALSPSTINGLDDARLIALACESLVCGPIHAAHT
jgi:hypothetical protein